jgi:3-deoxy-manno-octulosonate cytidylyltransferase (CMP-KDO synthetase)
MKFIVVIPARFASTRLPGKPLLDIGGFPMVVRVARQAALSGAEEVIVATDHAPIIHAAIEHGFKACLTLETHASGTDRIAEVAEKENWADDMIVVNVQGDEPLIPPELIWNVAKHLHQHPECAVSTAAHPIRDEAQMKNPNIVKVVLDKDSNALYFSRAPIPYPRDAFLKSAPLPETTPVLRHIGIYAYRASFLRAFSGLAPAAIEQAESLEQLRTLWHGYKIGVAMTHDAPPAGVDTEEDLLLVRRIVETGV